MVRLDVDIDEKLDSRFRNMVVRRLGMKKGNLSIAVEDALKIWLKYDGRELPMSTPRTKQTPELVASAS